MAQIGAFASLDRRYSFTSQYLMASTIFARRAAEIEAANPEHNDAIEVEHLGYVTAAIMQSTAALEAESAEITMHGPGCHLGSSGIDQRARAILLPLAEEIDDLSVVDRYAKILELLKKPPLDAGAPPCQGAALLVRLRNELVHFKSKWGQQMETQKLFDSLRQLRHPKPPFFEGNWSFFPHQCLSAACANWAVHTSVNFLNSFYVRLGIESVLQRHMEKLA